MATPTLSRHELDGTLGPIFVDVRAGGRAAPRPAVVIVHGFKGFKDWGFFPPFAERVARAGMTAVTFNMSGSGVDAGGSPAHADRFESMRTQLDLQALRVAEPAHHAQPTHRQLTHHLRRLLLSLSC